MRCAVFGCNTDNQSNNFDKNIKFISFPNNIELAQKWVHLCGRSDTINIKYARICSKHFDESNLSNNLQHMLLGYMPKSARFVKEDAIPTENLPNNTIRKAGKPVKDRDERLTKRIQKQLVSEILNQNRELPAIEDININLEENNNPVLCEPGPSQVFECRALNKIIENLTSELTKLKIENQILTEENQSLKLLIKNNSKTKNLEDSIRNIFTPGQIKKLETPNKRVKWSQEDISNAIAIHSASSRAYRLLLKKMYPLPAMSTLRSWCGKIEVEPGLLKEILSIMENVLMTPLDKICVLSLDEMKIKRKFLYNKSSDEVVAPANYVHVVMIRGLFGNWKQPIFYNYDCKMTKDLLFNIIKAVEQTGFHIVAMVSDLAGCNTRLLSELEVSVNHSWFQNPANEIEKIYVFADVPHLIKLIRNNFVDHGFEIDGEFVTKKTIEELLHHTSVSDLSIASKISTENLTVSNSGRQKVKLATKLFSHTISQAISRCGTLGLLESDSWIKCAEFFKLVNDWFDCLNVRAPYTDSRERVQGFGLWEDHFNILDQMNDVMLNMKVIGKKSLLPFQKGVIFSNKSAKLLFEDLKKKFDIKYILTYRLNQDVLENFFGVIRAKGGLHDHPDALEFKYRLRSYILGRNEGSISFEGNTPIDDTPDLDKVSSLSSICLRTIIPKTANEFEDMRPAPEELEPLHYDGLEHLAGYICFRLKDPSLIVDHSNDQYYTWTNHLTEGGLKKPSPQMMKNIEQLESIFNDVNNNSLLVRKDYIKNLIDLSIDVDCDEKIKTIFFRSRMFFRMKELNQTILDMTTRKRKFNKIIT